MKYSPFIKIYFMLILTLMSLQADTPVSTKDFGDAPSNYPHVSHKISPNLYLGNSVPDSEFDQQSSDNASGDGADDSDGVTNFPTLTVGDSSYTIPVKVLNNTGEVATITAWIDFNRDGIFQYDEALNTNALNIPSSNSPQNVDVTWDNFTDGDTTAIDNAVAGKTIMRIRLTTHDSRILRCDSEHYSSNPNNGDYSDNYLVSPNGEVEDYAINIDTGMKPLPCEASAFMFNDQPTKTSLINLSDGNIKDAVSDLSTTELNGAGYNQKDGYIWGVDQVSADGTLIKIGLDDQGNYVSQRVKIEGESFDAYVGDVDDNGHLYLKTGDKNSNNVIVIDLDPNSNKYLTKINHFNLTKNLVIHDWAFNPVDDFLYAVTKEKNKKRDNKLYKIDPKDGTVTLVGNTSMKEINSNIGASFFDKHGNMYVYSNKSGIIYKIPVSQGKSKATPFSTTSKVTRNDGAMCADVELEPSQEPFTCNDTLFISNRSELGTGDSSDSDTGATWLHSINRNTDPFSYTAIGEGYVSSDDGYNAVGYNVKDNFIYSLYLNHLLKIDKNGIVKDLGAVDGLRESQLYSGEFDRDGNFYVTVYGGGGDTLYQIDIDALKVTQTIPLKFENGTTADVKFWDMAIDETGQYFYMMILNNANRFKNDKFAKLNISTGVITFIDSSTDMGGIIGNMFNLIPSKLDSAIAVVFSDKLGNVYAQAQEGGFYKVNTETGKLKKISDTQALTPYNDATSCPDAVINIKPEPFTCTDTFYVSNKKNLESNSDDGKMWLHSINRENTPFDFNSIGDGYISINNGGYNAIGYNVKDNFIYGIDGKNLIQIDKNGAEFDLGEIDGFNYGQMFAGEFDRNGFYYVAGWNTNKMYKIDIDQKKVVKTINLHYKNSAPSDLLFSDIAIDKSGKYFYTMLSKYRTDTSDSSNGNFQNDKVVKIRISDGEMTVIGGDKSQLKSSVSLVYSDINGNVFMMNNESGYFKLNTTTGELTLISSTSYLAKYNDGTACPDATINFTEKDFGDAPEKYTHVSHKISKDLYLGNTVPDSEEDQQSSDDATGDGDDDNDAIVGSLPKLTVGNNSYTVPVKVFNNTGKIATITAWIDFNRDGIFQYDEALNTRNLEIPSSNSPQNVDITWDNTTDNETMAIENATAGSAIMRIRLSTSRILRCDDEHYKGNSDDVQDNYLISPDGEVEDYIIDIVDNKAYGRFNIERTNSGDFPIKTDERYAWYTQIVGRDFNYSIVFYNDTFTKEQNISNVTLDVDLMDMDKNESIYHYQFHVPDTIKKSRINILTDKDLDKLPATKNARFKVTYGVDDKGGIVMADCLTNPTVCTEHRSDSAKDNFAIRPEKFYVSIDDGEKERVNSLSPNPINFAAGYEYNLSVKAIKYFKNYPDFNTSEGYDGLSNRSLHFTTNGTSCRNIKDQDKEIRFNNGIYADTNFSNPFVGEYKLNIKEDNTWTEVDQNDRDCIKDNNSTSENPNEPSGCNITQVDDITINFQPDHFDVALNLGTVPASGHEDFVYMSELSPDYNNVAVQFTGKILAKNKNNDTTQNFTQHCVATNVLLDLNATTISTEGINQQVHTILGTPVNFTRYINYNSNSSHKTSEIIHTLETLNGAINLSADKFLDENNGTVDLDMKYNLNKNLTEPTNPVQVTFNRMDASSTDANSVAYDKIHTQSDMHTPSGFKIFDNNVKNFYFARVVSKKDTYPQINMLINPTVRTPLFVDFYCKTDNANYCDERNVSNNSRMFETTREQKGWYVSTKHNGQLDGNVTALSPNKNNIVTITENGADVTGTANNIMLDQGSNGTVTATFNNPGGVTIDISTSKVLEFNPSDYHISATDVNTSWTGVGIKASTLEIRPMDTPSKKMNW